jgi:hypothetical protein
MSSHSAWCFAALLCLVPANADVAPLAEAQCAAMKAHHVLNADAPVTCERLAVVRFSYVDFAGRDRNDGAVVVLDAVAAQVETIFAELYRRRFPIAKARPMEAYDGDDNAAMAGNNTSGFNHRAVAGSTRLSLHAYGVAIDLNPVQNPFLTHTGAAVTIAPSAGSAFVDRKSAAAGLAEAIVDVFAGNGFFEWGGDWNDPIDYQHFDIGRALAEKLARLAPAQARTAFESVVAAYQRCTMQNPDKSAARRRQICTTEAGN